MIDLQPLLTIAYREIEHTLSCESERAKSLAKIAIRDALLFFCEARNELINEIRQSREDSPPINIRKLRKKRNS